MTATLFRRFSVAAPSTSRPRLLSQSHALRANVSSITSSTSTSTSSILGSQTSETHNGTCRFPSSSSNVVATNCSITTTSPRSSTQILRNPECSLGRTHRTHRTHHSRAVANVSNLSNKNVQSTQKRHFSNGRDESEQVNMLTALNDALRISLEKDETCCIFGEDVAFGGVFRVTQNLRDEFGEDRVFNTPLTEQGIVGFGIGMACIGHTAIAEIQFADYIMPAWDQIVNEAAKFRYRSAGDWDCGKLTIRTASSAVGHGGLYHSQSPESYFAHCPGLKLVYPRGAYTAKGLLRAAIEEPDPVIFFEPKRMYAFPRENVPVDDYKIALGQAEVIKKGNDVTMIGWGALLTMTMVDACNFIEQRDGISVELIDLQTIMPFDEETIIQSVKKTGRLVIVHEATLTAGFGAELAATVQEKCFLHLEAPIQRVTGHDTPNGLVFEPLFIPDKYRIYEAVKKVVEY